MGAYRWLKEQAKSTRRDASPLRQRLRGLWQATGEPLASVATFWRGNRDEDLPERRAQLIEDLRAAEADLTAPVGGTATPVGRERARADAAGAATEARLESARGHIAKARAALKPFRAELRRDLDDIASRLDHPPDPKRSRSTGSDVQEKDTAALRDLVGDLAGAFEARDHAAKDLLHQVFRLRSAEMVASTPAPYLALSAMARSVCVIGQMLEAMGTGGLGGWLARTGRIFWRLIELAVPQSLWSLFTRHWVLLTVIVLPPSLSSSWELAGCSHVSDG